MDLKEAIYKSSTWTWDRLREARKFKCQIKEESLTDFVLLNLKKFESDHFKITIFTRHRESINGSDWEWWIKGKSSLWLGIRIQAKVLNLESDKYEHLHHKNKNGQQVDLLIDDAMRHNAIPLYCMFTNWIPKKFSKKHQCLFFQNSIRAYGCSSLSPFIVKKLQISNETKLNITINHLHPLHCIFCERKSNSLDLAGRAINYLARKNLIDYKNPDIHSLFQEFLSDEEPYYVKELLSGKVNEDFMDLPDMRLKRITVIEETE